MRVACVGGGPAGLFLAILVKLQDPHSDVTVYERRPSDTENGWGVVFWEHLLDRVRAADADTAERIERHAVPWQGQKLNRHGEIVDHEGAGFGIGRGSMLTLLTERARDLGVDLQFGREVSPTELAADFDVVAVCSGVNSSVHTVDGSTFGTKVVAGRNKYAWLGMTDPPAAFTFAFERTEAGWIWCHAYPFDADTATCVVECSPETWDGLEFGSLCSDDVLEELGRIFKPSLGDGRWIGTRTDRAGERPPFAWSNFPTITNERWHHGNLVLLGDAAHTTHYSIGSGMQLALVDAIVLAEKLREHATPAAAFAAYEQQRRNEIRPIQSDAHMSAQWFENVERYVDLPAAQMFALLRARRDPLLPHLPRALYARLYTASETLPGIARARTLLARSLRRSYAKLRHAKAA